MGCSKSDEIGKIGTRRGCRSRSQVVREELLRQRGRAVLPPRQKIVCGLGGSSQAHFPVHSLVPTPEARLGWSVASFLPRDPATAEPLSLFYPRTLFFVLLPRCWCSRLVGHTRLHRIRGSRRQQLPLAPLLFLFYRSLCCSPLRAAGSPLSLARSFPPTRPSPAFPSGLFLNVPCRFPSRPLTDKRAPLSGSKKEEVGVRGAPPAVREERPSGLPSPLASTATFRRLRRRDARGRYSRTRTVPLQRPCR